MVPVVTIPPKNFRNFLPISFEINSWKELEPFFEILLATEIDSISTLEKWLLRWTELEAAVDEDYAWRQIFTLCDTVDPKLTERYREFLVEIHPNLVPLVFALKKKLYNDPWFKSLDQKKYLTMVRNVRKDIEIYREENIQLQTEIKSLGQKYNSLIAGLSIEHEGEKFTLQKAAVFLEANDPKLREVIFRKISTCRTSEKEKLDGVFNGLLFLRHQVSKNAGFDSYTDFRFRKLGRFDYDQTDCNQFRDSIAKVVKPLYQGFLKTRREKLRVEQLFPWDLSVNIYGDQPLRPFQTADEMWKKTIRLFAALKPELGEMLNKMEQNGFIDLESRPGKAPGAFSYPLAETGMPFIFMNSVGTQADLTTIVHEGGHAIQAFMTSHLPLNAFKEIPSEVAELAAMSMELIAMDHFGIFYQNPDDLKRAKREQITRTLTLLPWIAAVDAFQKWVYDHADHTTEERQKEWVSIYQRYHGNSVGWEACPGELETMWHKQLHIFEMPFYYIEYGMAQLGAIAVWRNCKKDPEKGLQQYLDALALGYTKTIPEIYETAGIRFDFSESYIRELCEFVMSELEALD